MTGRLLRRLLLRLVATPAAVWDVPGEARVVYEDEERPPDSVELWRPR